MNAKTDKTKVAQVGGRTKQSQERGWQNIEKRIDKLIKERPKDELASLLVGLRSLNISRANPNIFYQTRPLVEEFSKNIFEKYNLKPTNNLFFPDLNKGTYGLNAISPVRYLMNYVRPHTEAIVELGSGWGSNLFQTYVGLGRTRSEKIDYIGAEYTDMGRNCSQKIANFAQHINFEDYPIDYRNPDLSFLTKYKKHILVYTHHSIEQVETVDHRLYQQLFDLDAEVTIIHFEPIGWQRDAKLLKARREGNDELFLKLGKAFPTAINTEKQQVSNAAWWSWRLKYNMNLTSITNRYVRSGQAKFSKKAYDYSGVGNVLNPTTLYHLNFIKK